MHRLLPIHALTGARPQSQQRRRQGLLLVILLVLAGPGLVALPAFVDPYTVFLLYTLFLYVALAQGWNLLGGYTGLVSLGQAAFFGLGAYVAALLLTFTDVPFLGAILASGLVASGFAVAISGSVFRFRGIYFAIGTLVLAEILRLWMINWSVTGGAQGINLPLDHLPDPSAFYYIGLALAAGATGILALVLHTRLGLGLRAIRDNEEAARNAGVNTFRVKLCAFAISAFIVGLAGGVQAGYLATIEPYSLFSFTWTVTAINIVLIGGTGTLLGPIIGAIFMTALSESLANYQTIQLILTGAILILVIRFLPLGIWGSLRAWAARRWTHGVIAKRLRRV